MTDFVDVDALWKVVVASLPAGSALVPVAAGIGLGLYTMLAT
ncbi:hypothetical protein [Herbidospora solisilvae]|nr:hypothetical protein [Herbidospora solisilvae]